MTEEREKRVVYVAGCEEVNVSDRVVFCSVAKLVLPEEVGYQEAIELNDLQLRVGAQVDVRVLILHVKDEAQCRQLLTVPFCALSYVHSDPSALVYDSLLFHPLGKYYDIKLDKMNLKIKREANGEMDGDVIIVFASCFMCPKESGELSFHYSIAASKGWSLFKSGKSGVAVVPTSYKDGRVTATAPRVKKPEVQAPASVTQKPPKKKEKERETKSKASRPKAAGKGGKGKDKKYFS